MKSERGTAVIEFALGFMVILLIAIGAYELGTAFVDRNAMANAAREGARAGSAAGDFDVINHYGVTANPPFWRAPVFRRMPLSSLSCCR